MQTRSRLIVVAAVLTAAIIVISSGSCVYLRHRRYVKEAKASVLRENLTAMRRAIKQYTEEYKQAPASLNDLVEAGYLSTIPPDPLTGLNTTWRFDRESSSASNATTPGIINVWSGAKGDDPDGIPLSKY